MKNWSQETRSIGIETNLGKDVFVLLGIKGKEAISELFSLNVEMASQRINLTPKDVIGRQVDVWLKLDDGSKRYLNGYINRFTLGPMKAEGYRTYHAEVVPWLWFHDQNKDCRVFQNQSVLEVIESLFSESNIANIQFNCQKQHAKLDYCVQYRESDCTFLSRLAEHNGLFFYFTHTQNQHKLVIADNANAYPDCITHSVTQTLGEHVGEHISTWDHQYQFIAGHWTQTDFDFKSPSKNLQTSANTVLDIPDMDHIERFDYPGGYSTQADGQSLTDINMMTEEERYDVVEARSNFRGFFAGGKFHINQHDFEQEKDKSYVITHLSFEVRDDTYSTDSSGQKVYCNEFFAIPSSMLYIHKEQKQKPTIYGPQTAIVVGPDGEKVYTDEYGRVKVKFHWDHHGLKNESSSCWVRVSQNWAGKQWGGMFLPHVNQEVIVSFLEGDPDKPIVTGRVYNAENMPPQELPTNKDKSIISDVSGNEIVMDATPGREQIKISSPGSAALILGNSNSNPENVQSSLQTAQTRAAPTPTPPAKEEDENVIKKGKFLADVVSYTVGDKLEIAGGSNYEFTVGNDTEIRVGTNVGLYGGAELEAKLAMSTEIHIGAQHEYSAGAKFEAHFGPSEEFSFGPIVHETSKDILSRAKADQVIAAGDQLCLAANCEDANANSRTLINLEKDEIILSIGNSPQPTKKISGHSKWYEKSGLQRDISTNRVIQIVTFLFSIVFMLFSQASTGYVTVARRTMKERDEDRDFSAMVGLGGTGTAGSLAIIALSNIVSIISSAVSNKDSKIEPVKHSDDSNPDTKINITKSKGVEIRSTTSSIGLASGKFGEDKKNAIMFLNKNGSLLGYKGSSVAILKNNDVIIDTTKSKAASAKIVLASKTSIVLETKNEVKIKSKKIESKYLTVLG